MCPLDVLLKLIGLELPKTARQNKDQGKECIREGIRCEDDKVYQKAEEKAKEGLKSVVVDEHGEEKAI
jgi:hypothetical protein